MAEHAVAAVRCLQVPLQGGLALLLPNAAVAEVVPYRAPEPSGGDDPRLLGHIEWRGLAIGVLAFEAFCGQAFAAPRRGGQLVVMHRLAEAGTNRYYAIAASGIPHLLVVRPDALQVTASASASRPVLQTVALGGETLMIPDPDRLEAELAALVG